jgi:hypothetical protein
VGHAGQPAQRSAESFQSLGEFSGDDPDLVRRSFGDLRQGLEVLVGERPFRRVGGVNGVEVGADRLGLTLGLQDPGLPVTVGVAVRASEKATQRRHLRHHLLGGGRPLGPAARSPAANE